MGLTAYAINEKLLFDSVPSRSLPLARCKAPQGELMAEPACSSRTAGRIVSLVLSENACATSIAAPSSLSRGRLPWR